MNRRWGLGSCTQFLAGFRWLQWQETLAINDAYGVATGDIGQDVYTTGCYNNLFGGQIGLDTALWRPSKHFRLEGLVKAGATTTVPISRLTIRIMRQDSHPPAIRYRSVNRPPSAPLPVNWGSRA